MENLKRKSFYGISAALAAEIFWGLAFIFCKVALKYVTPIMLLAIRYIVSFIFMSLLILTRAIKVSYKGKNLLGLTLMAIAQPVLYFIFEQYGMDMTSSALAGVIIALVPVFVFIMSGPFLNEKPTVLQVAGCMVSLCGVAVISMLSFGGKSGNPLGIILLFGAVISAAVFNILSRKHSGEFTPFERTYFMTVLAAITFNAIAFISLKGKAVPMLKAAFSHPDFIFSVLFLGLICSTVSFLLYNYAVSLISVTKASVFSNVCTVVSVLAGRFILNEDFSLVKLLLCVPVIAGIIAVNYQKEKKNE